MDEKYQVKLLENSILFDPEWYLSQHSDVESIEITPEQHYLRYGWRMGRSPSSLFCGVGYHNKYPDVALRNENPLIHYLRFGKREGREVQAVKEKNFLTKKDLNIDTNKLFFPETDNEKKNLNEEFKNQLKKTQGLLEKYVRRCRELEYQIIDEKN
ncbi:hypothetical protein [Microbulbifer sp. DLAB2-AA]|uniref:hypothetical protein n=1 Tax=Microbulbifer sp. DLAB2-AA TaxID=3243394 RepID=UPI00403A0DFE